MRRKNALASFNFPSDEAKLLLVCARSEQGGRTIPVRHSGGPLGLTLTLTLTLTPGMANLRNGGPPEWGTGMGWAESMFPGHMDLILYRYSIIHFIDIQPNETS